MHHHHEAPVAGQSQVYDDRKMGNQAADSGTVDSVHAAFNNGNTLNNLGDDATYGGIIGDFADDSTTNADATGNDGCQMPDSFAADGAATVGAVVAGGNAEDETSETSAMEPKAFVASSKGLQRKASVYTGFDVQELDC